MAAATSQTAPDSPAGESMVVLLMRRLSADEMDSDDPFGASFAWKVVSLIVTASGPEVAMLPPWPEVTLKS